MMAILVVLLMYLISPTEVHAQVRTVKAKPDEILTIKTALGIATIIQTPDVIQSAIIGDQSGFKVEYLDRAVTIKPLRNGAKTNLYLVTEKRRFNLRLATLGHDSADYIVYIKTSDGSPKTKWVQVNRTGETGGLKLSVSRVGYSGDGFVLLDAKLTYTGRINLRLRPEQIWIIQDGSFKVINGLFLSDLQLTKTKPILIGLSIAKSEVHERKPISLEIRGNERVSVSIPEVNAWR